MGETLGRQENIASPRTRRKSVGVVLAEAEYINSFAVMLILAILEEY